MNDEILKAIEELKDLEEIIFCFDNDEAGRKAVKKYAEDFRDYKVTTVELPNKDVNETLQLHDEIIFTELLNNRKIFFFQLKKKKLKLQKQSQRQNQKQNPKR